MKFIRKAVMLFLFGYSFQIIQQIQATEISEEPFTVTIHKRLFDKTNQPMIQNTGRQMDIGGKPLSGVEFQVYDATNRYDSLLKEKAAAEVIPILQEEYASTLPAQSLQKKLTDEEGIAVFTYLAEISENKQAVYVFVETAAPTYLSIVQKAAPVVLVTPIYSLDGNGEPTNTKLANVHIYPKNIGYVPSRPKEPNKPNKPTPSKPKIPPKPNRPILPMTGQAKSFLSLLGIAILVFIGWLWQRRRKK